MYMNLFARAAIAKCIVLTLGVALAHQASATDLTVHLVGTATLSRKTVQYQCDAAGAKMGLPAKPFPVEYITGAGNSLVVVPVGQASLIFAGVTSGSGARYAAQQYIWWEAGGGVTFSSDSMSGQMSSTCKPVAP
jgi:membrane-bound inhibitor of C-type lysozyme